MQSREEAHSDKTQCFNDVFRPTEGKVATETLSVKGVGGKVVLTSIKAILLAK